MKKTKFETTTENIQKIITAINENNLSSHREITQITGIKQTVISTNIRRIKEIQKINGLYKCDCQSAEETKWISKMKKSLEIVLEKKEILLWQDKYISALLKISIHEVQQLRAYADEYIKEQLTA